MIIFYLFWYAVYLTLAHLIITKVGLLYAEV